jgi:pyruvate formate lyase activating enzyme
MNFEKKISVFNIKRFAVHDGPGIRTTVFIKDCRLHCPWCQNPEGISHVKNLLYQKNKCIQCHQCISACPENVIIANAEKYIWIDRNNCTLCDNCVNVCPTGALEFDSKEWKISDLTQELLKDKVFFEESNGGITISGGEPLLYPEIILELANELKKNAVHLAVETSLMVSEKKLQEVVDVFDLFILDIKLLYKTDAQKTIGLNLELYKKNLELLFANDAELICRFPLIPDYTTSETNLYASNSLINSLNNKYKRNVQIEPINFNPLIKSKCLQLGKPLPVLNNWNKFTQTEMQYFYSKLNHER